MVRKKCLAGGLLVLVLAITDSSIAQEKPMANTKTASVEQAWSTFLTSFDNLDWEAFRDCFSSTATVFHPTAPNIRRVDSPEEFEKAWLGVFERIKKNSGRTSPPYMILNPLDLRVERLSDDVTLVTFHLVDGSILNRRTLVFKREPTGWKIVHVHASNLSLP
jgi:ketosteroid isomerase-like protein